MIRKPDDGVEIQQRDTSLMLELFESRMATREQLCRLLFEGRTESTRKRLDKLASAGLITFLADRPSPDRVYQLAKGGFNYLLQQGHLASYPSTTWERFNRRRKVGPSRLMHELSVMQAKTALASGFASTRYLRAKTFTTWPHPLRLRPHQHFGKRATIEADGYLHVLAASQHTGLVEHHLFLEVDRSTESQRVIAEKAKAYLAYYRSGAFAERQGLSKESYKAAPFRVLLVCRSAARRDNLARMLVEGKPTIRALVWLTTMEELDANPLGLIWVTPGMYKPWPALSAPIVPDQLRKMALFEPQDIDRLTLGQA